MNLAMNIFANNMLNLGNINTKQGWMGNSSLLNFGISPPNYKPTDYERTLYFILKNG